MELIVEHADAIPLRHALEVMELLYPSFNVPPGFNPSAPLPSSLHPCYKQVKYSVHALGRIGSRMAFSGDFSYKTYFLSSWPNILKWANYYFVNNSGPVVTHAPGGRASKFPDYKALGELTALFGVFTSIETGYSNPAYRDDTFALLAKLWLKLSI